MRRQRLAVGLIDVLSRDSTVRPIGGWLHGWRAKRKYLRSSWVFDDVEWRS
jgi:hypothetical protein